MRRALPTAVILAALVSATLVAAPAPRRLHLSPSRQAEEEALRRRVERLDAKIDDLRRQVEARLPVDGGVDAVIERVSASALASGLTVTHVKAQGTFPAGLLVDQPVDLVMTGSFEGFYRHLQDLDLLTRVTVIDPLRIARGPQGQVDAAFTLHIYSQQRPPDPPPAGVEARIARADALLDLSKRAAELRRGIPPSVLLWELVAALPERVGLQEFRLESKPVRPAPPAPPAPPAQADGAISAPGAPRTKPAGERRAPEVTLVGLALTGREVDEMLRSLERAAFLDTIRLESMTATRIEGQPVQRFDVRLLVIPDFDVRELHEAGADR